MRPQLWLTREPGPKLKKYLACLNSMPKIPGCPHTSGHILQCVSQHALLAIPTRNPLQQHILHISWARETAQTDDSTLALFQMAHFFFSFYFFFLHMSLHCDWPTNHRATKWLIQVQQVRATVQQQQQQLQPPAVTTVWVNTPAAVAGCDLCVFRDHCFSSYLRYKITWHVMVMMVRVHKFDALLSANLNNSDH